MEHAIEKYILENNSINIMLSLFKDSEIISGIIYLYYLEQENSDLFQKIILSGKHIYIEIYYGIAYYKNVSILSYANEIAVYDNMTSENIIDIIHQPNNLQKITIKSEHISQIDVRNKLYEKKFLKYIQIMFQTYVHVNAIYEIMQIKQLSTLCLDGYHYTYLTHKNIFEILSCIVNYLDKNIKIILYCDEQGNTFKKYASLITYNFNVDFHHYIFTYITPAFRKFDNLYDFNLCYQ